MSHWRKDSTNERLSVDDLKPYMALVSSANGVRHIDLSEKFIMEWPPTLKEALKMIESCIQLETSMSKNRTPTRCLGEKRKSLIRIKKNKNKVPLA